MSITDELREYASTRISPNKGQLTAIADRIDAEHESKVGCTSDEWDYWESTHVELPKDANGEPIYVGDELDGYGKTIEVVELRIGRSGWVIVSRDGNAYADTYAFAHHKPPTVEDVLREFVYAILNQKPEFREENIAEYASKLQLKENA